MSPGLLLLMADGFALFLQRNESLYFEWIDLF